MNHRDFWPGVSGNAAEIPGPLVTAGSGTSEAYLGRRYGRLTSFNVGKPREDRDYRRRAGGPWHGQGAEGQWHSLRSVRGRRGSGRQLVAWRLFDDAHDQFAERDAVSRVPDAGAVPGLSEPRSGVDLP